MNPQLQTHLEQLISELTDSDCFGASAQSISGGCINQTWRLKADDCSYFIKLNSVSTAAMFAAENEALVEIAETATIRVPKPIADGMFEAHSFIVLEYLELSCGKSDANWQRLGTQLAKMHRCTLDMHGWHRNNTIGRTPQRNTRTSNWADFFCNERLTPQLELARQNGYQFSNANALLSRARALLANHQPAPSILHGDLWSGNASFLDNGCPVIYDPASYYGDRETDIAFSEFFGGFPASFYRSYNQEWPLPPGYTVRKQLYNVYHVLNHVNLFGGSYQQQAEAMIEQLIK